MEQKGLRVLSGSSLDRSSSKFKSIAQSSSTLKAIVSSPPSLSSFRIMTNQKSNASNSSAPRQQQTQQQPPRPCTDYCFVSSCFCYDGCVTTPIYPEYANQLYQVQGASAQNKRKTFCQQFKLNGFFYLTISVMIICNVAFLIVDARYLIQEIHLAVVIISQILFVIAFLALFATACADPGILPRATEDEVHKTESEFHQVDGAGYVRTRDILIYGQGMKLKYCWTCRFYRPPRASHCSVCNNCVDKFDHHCPWIGNCVGRRNYRSFFLFLLSLSALGIYVSACLIVHLVLLTRKVPIGKAISSTPMTMVLLILVVLAIWSVLGLSGFHCYLVMANITTNEDIKSTFVAKKLTGKGGETVENPFTQGSAYRNCCHNLCASRTTSLIRHV